MQIDPEADFSKAALGDARRTGRAMGAACRWAAKPDASFPEMFEDDAELQGFYGLVGNDKVDHRELVAAHAGASRARIEQEAFGKPILVVHDTTSFEFGGESERVGLGWVSRDKQGFFAHMALALSADGTARPFGVVGVSTFMRERPLPIAKRPKRKHDGKQSAFDPERESLRWGALVDETSRLLRGCAVAIHITDREADSYEYLSGRVVQGQRFVARVREFNRPVTLACEPDAAKTKLHLVAERIVSVAERPAKISRRPRSALPAARRAHPERKERVARLEFGAERVRIPRPKHLRDPMPEFIEVNLVHVREPEPPPDAEPVEWLLLTSEPTGTPDEILKVVDYYRARWTIEELNKAIKTGCQYEKRQLESGPALLRALALCIPVACQMLALRHQSRANPDAPATTVLSEQRLAALRTIARKPLTASPTVREIFFAIAALGGHLSRNGPPGWHTLRRGLDHLLIVEAAFEARDAEKGGRQRSDQ